MKIGFSGIDVNEGKIKYEDDKLTALADKFNPNKVTPFYAEFIENEFIQVDAIVLPRNNLLDILISDLDKCESRIKNISDDSEIKLLNKCISKLEEEIPLCDVPFNKDELEKMRSRSMISIKPVVVFDDIPEVNDIITRALDKAQVVFFYTAGKKEVHAWPVARNSDIVTCAGKIHTDLARGFIRADIVSFDDIMACHSMNDAKAKGLAKVVDKDYIIGDSDVIEIRYNV